MYVAMLRIYQFEERVEDLLVEGKIKCPASLYTGQEAVAAAVCAALRQTVPHFTGTGRMATT